MSLVDTTARRHIRSHVWPLTLALLGGCAAKPPPAPAATPDLATQPPARAERAATKGVRRCSASAYRLASADKATTSTFAAYAHKSCDRVDLLTCGPLCGVLPEVCLLGKPSCELP
jgi:type IV pilus biogenesis protein CpaD/CtpE